MCCGQKKMYTTALTVWSVNMNELKNWQVSIVKITKLRTIRPIEAKYTNVLLKIEKKKLNENIKYLTLFQLAPCPCNSSKALFEFQSVLLL